MGSILLVESDEDTRDQMGSALREAGHGVLVAATTREAFARISEGGIDAVIVDSYDPRVAVVELAKNLEALPDAPPIVLVSASPHAPEISARIGAAMFLPKPLDASDVVDAMARLLGFRPVRPMTEDDFSDEETTSSVRRSG